MKRTLSAILCVLAASVLTAFGQFTNTGKTVMYDSGTYKFLEPKIVSSNGLVTVFPSPSDNGKAPIWNTASNAWIMGAGGGGGTTTASLVSYVNPTYTNVQQALDALFYVAPGVSLTGGGSYEQGQVITNVALSWTVNKTMVTRNLSAPVPPADQARGPGGNGSYTHVGANIAANTTYGITVGDGTGFASSSTSLGFYYRRYYGVATNVTGITDAEIKLLGTSELSTTRVLSTYMSASNQYVYVVYPAAWGAATFKLYDLPSTGWQLETRNSTNNYGVVASYNIYRSQYTQTSGSIHVEVF